MMSGGLRANARIAGLMVLGGGIGLLAVPALAQMNLPPSVGQFQGITGAPSIGGQAPAGMASRAGPPPPAGLPGAQSNPGHGRSVRKAAGHDGPDRRAVRCHQSR